MENPSIIDKLLEEMPKEVRLFEFTKAVTLLTVKLIQNRNDFLAKETKQLPTEETGVLCKFDTPEGEVWDRSNGSELESQSVESKTIYIEHHLVMADEEVFEYAYNAVTCITSVKVSNEHYIK